MSAVYGDFFAGGSFFSIKIFSNIVRYNKIHKETHLEIIEIKISILETKFKNMQKKFQ